MNEEVQNIAHYKDFFNRMVQKCVQARQSARQTQDDMAKWLGVDRRKIIAIESGKGDFELLLRYCDKMSIDVKFNYTEF